MANVLRRCWETTRRREESDRESFMDELGGITFHCVLTVWGCVESSIRYDLVKYGTGAVT